jgi:hypothetical protein
MTNRQVNPVISFKERAATGNTTQKITDTLVRYTSTGAARTFTLLPAADWENQIVKIIAPTDCGQTYPFTIDGDGSELVGLATTLVVKNPAAEIELRSNGTSIDILNDQSLKINKSPLITNTLTAKNTTGAVTATELAGGGISSTSAATVTATLPTATLLAAALSTPQNPVAQGSWFDFAVDNSAGSNVVTVALNTGITAAKQVSAGDSASDILLTVPASGNGLFRVYFNSTTSAILYRLG